MGLVSTTRADDLWSGLTFYSSVLRLDDQTGYPQGNDISYGSGGLSYVGGLTVGPDGNVYVSSLGSSQILFYNGTTGAPLTLPAPGSVSGQFALLTDPSNTPGPNHLLFGPEGNLYVGDQNGPRVRVFNGTTGVELDDAAAVTTSVGGLAFSSLGDLYVGDFAAGTVWKRQGNTLQPFISPGTSLLQTPTALLFTPTGDLLVVDVYGNQVLRYNKDGVPQYRYAADDTNHEHPQAFITLPPPIPDNYHDLGATAPTNSPVDITYDKDGNLVVSVLGLTPPPDNRGAIYRYDMDGNLLQTIAQGMPGIGGVDYGWLGTAPAAGDFDKSGAITNNDYAKWRMDFGKFVAAHLGADGSGDGGVGAADYAMWRKASVAPGAPSLVASVPEPATIGFLFVAAVLAAVHRPRRP